MRWGIAICGLVWMSSGLYAQFWYPPGAGITLRGRNFAFSAYYTPNYSSWYNPWLGWGQSTVIVMSPQVVVRPPRIVLPPDDHSHAEPPAPVATKGRKLLRVEDAVKRGELLVIQPNEGKPVAPLEIGPGGRVPMVLGEEQAPPQDPKSRSVYEVKRAKAAFLRQQYGLATERLEAALQIDPNVALPWFLLAQVQTARGMYREAVLSIQNGMKLAPEWPTVPFKLGELYDEDAPHFAEHLAQLKAAQKSRGEPLLDFLLGYHYWFLGDRAEAIKLLRKASAAVRDNAIIEQFLLQAKG